MKKVIYILVLFLPVFGSAQQPWYKSSPLDYMWKNVGNAGFSEGEAAYTSLACSPAGEPYIAFSDWANGQKATVIRLDGTNWLFVGQAGFSHGQIECTNLAFSPSDSQPYAAYLDVWNSYKATVMKYDSVFVGINEPNEGRSPLYPNPASRSITIDMMDLYGT